MDVLDHAIVRELQQSGRLTNQELADRVGLSPSPCLRRVRRLEEAGIIASYTAVVDQARYGLPITAFVRLRLDRHDQDTVARVEEAIRGIDHVVEAHLMAGDADFLLKVAIESLEAYEDLVRTEIRSIPALASIDTSFAFGTTKRPSPFPVPDRRTVPA